MKNKFNISKFSSISVIASCLIFASCKKDTSNHHYIGPDDSQAIVISTQGFMFNDKGSVVLANGSWLKGSPFPRNQSCIKADQKTMSLSIANAIILDFAKPAMLVCEMDEYPIQEWNDAKIVTKKVRCGSSNRFLQITIDRKAKKIFEDFTGESPTRVLFGDGIKQFSHPDDFHHHKL